MIRHNRFVLAAAAMIGIGIAPHIPIVAVPPPSVQLAISKQKRRILELGESYQPAKKWPYNGKNRAQRVALNNGFFAMC